MPLPVFVINLPDSAERRADMERKLKTQGLEYSFIEAVDGKSIGLDEAHYDRTKRLRYFGRDLTAGEIGCFLSHRKAYQKMVDENIPTAIIFEDDVVFKTAGFKQLMDDLLKAPVKWDVIRFLAPKSRFKIKHRLSPTHTLLKIYGVQGGTYGYIMTLKAARTMLEHSQKAWVPIDTALGRIWETGLEVLYLSPAPVEVDFGIPSIIGESRFVKKIGLNGLDRVLFPFYRAWYKISEGVHKKISYWLS